MCAKRPEKGRTLLEKGLGLTYQSRNRSVYLNPLLDLGLLVFTDKENEKSKQQRYAITEKGKALIG
jgi:predicted transcriptional regulator